MYTKLRLFQTTDYYPVVINKINTLNHLHEHYVKYKNKKISIM